MLNRQSSRHSSQALIPVSSSGLLETGVLDTLYAGRERTVRPVKLSSYPQERPPQAAGSVAIWGLFTITDPMASLFLP